jgi:hypothetical protein
MYDKAILVRLERKTVDILRKVARARGEQVSGFARRAIMSELAKLGFLDEQETRALGIHPTVPTSSRNVQTSPKEHEEMTR